MQFVWTRVVASLLPLFLLAGSVPAGFPSSGNGLWYQSPGTLWSKEWLPIGNGYIAAMTPGGTLQETTQLNLESLWSGGPFQDPNYNGGNKQPSEQAQMAEDMQEIRQAIFRDGTIGDIEELCTDPGAYGSYAGAGYLITTIGADDVGHSGIYDYARWLDLDEALSKTSWSQNNETFVRTSFCSHATPACFQYLNHGGSHSNGELATITHSFSAGLEDGLPTANVSCMDDATLLVQGSVSNPGMSYELLFRATAIGAQGRVECELSDVGAKATLVITNASETWVTWVGDTQYNIDAGDSAHGYSFAKPLSEIHKSLVDLLDSATNHENTIQILGSAHISAYKGNLGDMRLSLTAAEESDSRMKPTDEIKAAYATDVGDPYLELLLFNYGRYLLASSAPGTLPANLQGKWALGSANPWSGDYHANINVQMNYWFAEMTGMPSGIISPLFNFMEKTLKSRGADTAQTLYNISRGWVTHDEMNIFGHTGMKLYGNSAECANYPESAVWMMMQVYDHYEYTQDVTWWQAQGWPLLKGVASFHLDKLLTDTYHNDGSLVVSPCNSPEQAPITFGCAHAQQLIWQMFNSVEKTWHVSADSDTNFLDEVRQKRAIMDKGVCIGSWGQLQEWKIDMDSPNDTHRHLSHLVGLYPGYAVASYDPQTQGPITCPSKVDLTNAGVLEAAKTSLLHRGNGTGPDGDAGWEKVWRAAAWAQLNDAGNFYHQLTYAVERNFGPNLLSLYDPLDENPIIQIDANLGYPAAVLNALVQAPDTPSNDLPLVITLLPALPPAWSSGSARNVHLRRGMSLDMTWSERRLVTVQLRSVKAADPSHIAVTLVFAEREVSLTVEPGQNYDVQL